MFSLQTGVVLSDSNLVSILNIRYEQVRTGGSALLLAASVLQPHQSNLTQ